jgi:NADPH-dependent ferric siderophore reductase
MSTIATPAPRKRRAEHPLTTIPATVVARLWLTPRMVRLTLHSDQMSAFIRPRDPDQFLTAIFPRPGQELIELQPDFDWHYFYGLPSETRPQARNYTIRSFDLAANTVDIDILVHGGPGLGEHWAINVQPGAPLFLWGPRIAYNPFPNAEFYLLFCDECGVPAAAAIMESLPSHVMGRLVAEVKDEQSIPPVPSHSGIQVDWIFSGDAEPGETDALLRAIEQVSPTSALVYAWGGGEMGSLRKIGRHLRKNWGLKTASISATGYWRAGVSAED